MAKGPEPLTLRPERHEAAGDDHRGAQAHLRQPPRRGRRRARHPHLGGWSHVAPRSGVPGQRRPDAACGAGAHPRSRGRRRVATRGRNLGCATCSGPQSPGTGLVQRLSGRDRACADRREVRYNLGRSRTGWRARWQAGNGARRADRERTWGWSTGRLAAPVARSQRSEPSWRSGCRRLPGLRRTAGQRQPRRRRSAIAATPSVVAGTHRRGDARGRRGRAQRQAPRAPRSGTAGPRRCGTYLLSTCDSAFDTVARASTRAPRAGPSHAALTQVALNDDDGPACGGSDEASVNVTANLGAGRSYYIAVDGHRQGEGAQRRRLRAPRRRPGQRRVRRRDDDLRTAATIVSGSNAGADLESGEPALGSSSVWWRWTAPATRERRGSRPADRTSTACSASTRARAPRR